MIPLSLITGWLGCGKTTFLKKVIRENRDRRLVYLINDFSPLDVDAGLLEKEGGQVVSIPGGSIFCKCLVTEFIGQLRRVAEEFNTPENPVEGVLIEASGMADPRVVGDMLRETRLDNFFEIRSVISLVEPRSFLRLIHTLPNLIAQIQASDCALLNKCDLYDEAQLARTEAELRKIKPDLEIKRCVQAEAEVVLFEGHSTASGLHGEYAKCRDPHYDRFETPCTGPVDLDQLRALIAVHEEELYRVKGFLQTGSGPVYFDGSKAGVQITPHPSMEARAAGLAWIVRAGTVPSVFQVDGLQFPA